MPDRCASSLENGRDARYWIFADIQYADNFQLILADTIYNNFLFLTILETTITLIFNNNLFVRIK